MASNESDSKVDNKSGLSDDFKRTYLFFYGFLVFGLLIVLIGQWSKHPLAALLWSVACLATGGFVGFLFGIPKVAQPDASGSTSPGLPAGSPFTGPSPNAAAGYRLLVNTNLTDISDWLTKIIVGLTLIELQKIPQNLNSASLFIADSLGGMEEKSFADTSFFFRRRISRGVPVHTSFPNRGILPSRST